MILGLDASSSVVGYTILDDNKRLERIGYITIGGFEDLLEKGKFLKLYFEDILKDYNITSIYIEDISKMFHQGFSSAQVITTLARFNGMISFIIYELTKVKPIYIMSSSARKTAYQKSFERGSNIKLEVFNEVMKLHPQLVWLKNNKDNPRNERFDATDSFTMALAGYRLNGRKLL